MPIALSRLKLAAKLFASPSSISAQVALLMLLPGAAQAAEAEVFLKCTMTAGKSYPLIRENPAIYNIGPDFWYYWSSKDGHWMEQCNRLGNITNGRRGAKSACEISDTKFAVHAYIEGEQSSSLEIDRRTGTIATSDISAGGSVQWDDSSTGTCQKTTKPVAPPAPATPGVKF